MYRPMQKVNHAQDVEVQTPIDKTAFDIVMIVRKKDFNQM